MTGPLRVVIADDHPPTRDAVREALERDGCVVVADVGDAPRAVAAAAEHQPDVCLLDIHMPGNGIAAASAITEASPGMPVVMLTASEDDEDLYAALRAGASGYLPKLMDPDRLPDALRGVLAGEVAMPRWLVLKVIEQFRETSRVELRPRRRTSALTSREAEILALMSNGLTTGEIAKHLFVAPVTVRTHIATIVKKLRVPDREAAIRLSLADREH